MGKVTQRHRPQIGIATTVGSVDATVITSPAEFAAEKQGLRVIMPARELGDSCAFRSPASARRQKKIEKDPDEIVRLLRALRLATLYLLNNPEYRQSVFQRMMRVRGRHRTPVAFTNCLN